MVLETRRLILRPWSVEDAKFLYQYAKDPRVGPSAGWPVHTSVTNSQNIISEVLSGANTLAIVLKELAHPIGSIGIMFGEESFINLPEDEAEIGYWIGVPFWGQQIVPEALGAMIPYGFENLNLKKLWCVSFEDNVQSIRVQEKCGFEYQFTRNEVYRPLIHEKHSERVTCLTKEKWYAKKAWKSHIILP